MRIHSKYFVAAFLFLAAGMFMSSCKQKTGKEAKETLDTMVEEVIEAVAPNTLTKAEQEEGWELLFDGETFEGWKGYNKDGFPEAGWEIDDNAMRCIGSGKGEAGGKGGDIITEDKFKWFKLKLDWKVGEGGNSGILYLVQEKPGQAIWKSAPEMQVLDNEGHIDGAEPVHQAGALYDLIPAEPQNAKPAGEWNEVMIVIYKGTVEHWQNGEKVVEYHLWTDDWKNMVAGSKFAEYEDFVDPAEEGHIGLQDHGDDVWFRNIKILELE